MKTLEQQRASYAWNKLEQLLSSESSSSRRGGDGERVDASRIVMYLQRLPAMTLANGLGQTLAFLLSKSEGKRHDPAYVVFDILAEWLVDERRFYTGDRSRLVAAIMAGDRRTYRLAHYEALGLLSWLKDFSRAYDVTAGENSRGAQTADAT